jgi:chorismate mutase
MGTLEQLRNRIDKVDAAIIEKLAERQKLSREIGLIKQQINREIVDYGREDQLIQRYKQLCMQYELDPVFVKELFEMIIRHSRGLQK